MDTYWNDLLLNIRVADVLDVLLASVVMYAVLQWLRAQATHAMLFGAVAIGVLWAGAHLLGMYLTLAAFRFGLTVVVVGYLIIFQQDLRQGFEQLITWRPWMRSAPAASEDRAAELLVESVMLLAREQTGALLVLQGRQPLERHLRGGIPADALVSTPLLHGIFNPKSQGHDGGVILANNRVQLFAAHLPLSERLSSGGQHGTRHAAALGLAERCDSLIIVVSEETGTISVAESYVLTPIESASELQQRLTDFLADQSTPTQESLFLNSRWGRAALRLASVVVAVGLWFAFAFEIESVQRTISDVPVEIRELPETFRVVDVRPSKIDVTLTGLKRAFANFSVDRLTASIPLKQPTSGRTRVSIADKHFELPEGIALQFTEPREVLLSIEQTAVDPDTAEARFSGQELSGISMDLFESAR